MGISVNSIPSINLPITDKQGRIIPVWYEFFRKFIASTVETTPGGSSNININAGAGLIGGGDISDDITLAVGAGSGITVNANDVNVDIMGQAAVQASLDDEIMIADLSDNGAIRKTKIRDVIEPARTTPGGAQLDVQYNDSGNLAGDSRFTHSGDGNVLVRHLIVNGANDSNATRSNLRFVDTAGNYANKIYWTNTVDDGTENPTTYFISSAGGAPVIQGASSNHQILTQNNGFQISFGVGRSIDFRQSEPGIRVNGPVGIYRSTTSAITASTAQTQGSEILLTDINEVSVCANANDTVTLPTAIVGRYCVIINNGVQTLQVFPGNGNDLGAGLNNSTTIAAGAKQMFLAYNTINWSQLL